MAEEGGNPKPKEKDKVIAVYKINKHCACEGCVKKIHDEIKGFPGVEQVKIDCESIILSVTGKVDPNELKKKVADKTNKKIELICVQPEKKPNPPKEPPKDPPKPTPPPKKPCTLDLKITTSCDGCMRNLRRVIVEFDGCKHYCQGCKSYCQGCSTCQEAKKKDH